MKKIYSLIALALLLTAIGCKNGGNNQTQTQQESTTTADVKVENTDPLKNKGIGPVKEVHLDEQINENLANQGAQLFIDKCSACHKPDKKFIGPAPKDILKRRSPEWVMNMILNPENMIQQDPIAKQLLKEANGAPMANQGLTQEQARAVLEYFRTL